MPLELDPRFTFDTFVVGPANRLAAAAARRVADSPGSTYNLLFLYGGSGLGKTHLLTATGHRIGRDERLLVRLSGGLILDIAAPDFETRVAIARRKAEERGQTLAGEVYQAPARIAFNPQNEVARNRLEVAAGAAG